MKIGVYLKQFTVPVIGPGFGNGSDDSGIGPADLSIGAAADYLKLPHSGKRKEKNGVVAAALIALQWIIEVRAIQRNIGVDGALPGDDKPVAVRFLVNARRHLHKVGESPATARRTRNESKIDARRAFGLAGINGTLRVHLHRLRLLVATDTCGRRLAGPLAPF